MTKTNTQKGQAAFAAARPAAAVPVVADFRLGLRSALLGGVSLLAIASTMLPGTAQADAPGGSTCIGTQLITTSVGPLTDALGGSIIVNNTNGNPSSGRVTGAGNGPGILIGDCGGAATILNQGGSIVGNTGVQINAGGLAALIDNTWATYNTGTVSHTVYGSIWGTATAGVKVDGMVGSLVNQYYGNLIYGAAAGITVSSGGEIVHLDNAGQIAGSQRGIRNGGLIDNLNNSGTISGLNVGVRNDGTIGTLTNSGWLVAYSTVSNGLYNTGIVGSIFNSGTIYGNSAAGGLLNQGTVGLLSNSGLILGGNIGLGNEGSIGTLVSSGTIMGTFVGISNSSIGVINTLMNSGTISAMASYSAAGIFNAGSIGSLTNSGLIAVPGGPDFNETNAGIWNTVTGSIGVLLNSGTIQAGVPNNYQSYGYATGINNQGHIGSLTNSGRIAVYGSSASGIWNQSTGSIGMLTNTGTIFARGTYNAGGISNDGQIGTLVNSGLIDVATSIISGKTPNYATGIYNGGTIGALTNSGTIAVSANTAYGVYNSGSIGSLTNNGVIVVGAAYGTGIYNSGSITSLTNNGAIAAGFFGSNNGTFSPVVEYGINNAGMIDGLVNGSIGTILAGGTLGAVGIQNSGTIGTLDNAGNIFALSLLNAGGVVNSGSITSLLNTGTINAWAFNTSTISGGVVSAAGIANSGVVNSLVNSGTIAAWAFGYNDGSIGATIADAAGIYNTGSIGSLTNSGLIGAFAFGTIYGTFGTVASHAIGIMNGARSFIETTPPQALTSTYDTIATIGVLTNSGTILAFHDSVGSATGILNVGRIGTLTNSGFIGGQDVGIGNAFGTIGTLANSSTGNIIGGTIGISNVSGGYIGVLDNAGTIYGGNTGIYSGYGSIGLLTNSGTISGTHAGISSNFSTFNTLVNSGTIHGGNTGIYMDAASIGTLTNSGTISGGSYGMYLASGSIGVMTNSGTISGGSYGMYVASFGIGTLTNSSLITGGTNGIYTYGTIGTLTNSGTISGGSYGINNAGSIGLLTNSGRISGGSTGIYNSEGSIGTLTNSGTITGGRTGVTNGGYMGVVSNSGLISGGTRGFYNNGTVGSLTNSGTITGTRGGVGNYAGTIGLLSNTSTGRITSAGTGVVNNARIGTLTNAGIISGGTIGIRNMGTLGSIGLLSNSNSITGGRTGLFNTGSIGSLTNSGTIAGSIYALYSSGGGLPAVNNSGIINGNILISGQNATINGSNTDVFGALVNGNTTITNGNLTFGSGNLYLAHNVTVNGGTGTVFNTANVLVTAAQSITGNYVQSSGGLLTVGIASLVNSGRLNVSGTVDMTNGHVLILPLNNFKLPAGSQYVLVDSATPVGTSYAGVQHVLQGYNSTIASTIINGHYDLILTAFTPITTNTTIGNQSGQYQGPMGRTLDTINNQNTFAASAFYNAVLRYVDALPAGSAQQHAVVQTGPVQINPVGLTFQVAAPIVQNFEQHQLGFDALAQGTSRTGTSAGSAAHNLSIWMQAMGGLANRSGTGSSDGYHSSHGGVMFGTDWKPTPNLLVGAGFATVFGRATASGITTGSNTSTTSYQFVGYSTYRFMPNTFAYGQVGGGFTDFNQNRRIGFLGTTARAKYTGNQVTAKVGLGHDIALPGSMMGMPLTLTPLVGMTFMHANTGSYQETGAGLANLAANSASANSVTSDVGARLAGQVQTGIGLIRPEVRLAWVHEFENTRLTNTGQLYNVGYQTTNRRIAANGVRVNLAATLIQSDRLTIRAEYEGDLRSGYNAHSGLVRAALGF